MRNLIFKFRRKRSWVVAFAALVCFPFTVTGQVRAKVFVSGTVIERTREPLAGAMILEKASGNGTITDADGRFSLSVSPDATIEISFIGYITQTIKVDIAAPMEIVMEEDAQGLDEVVVVGYSVQRKVNLSGAVDQISAKQLEARPINNLSKGLQGMIPNLNIDFTSGEPGQAAKINIRGLASINGGSPLILIDGVAADAEELNRLLPGDIATLSVLKDASSAAIYGARAAFGVILITTKQGDGDKIQVDYNNHFSWKRPSNLPEKSSDPYIYLKLKNISVLNTPWSSGHVTGDERLEWARQRSDDPTGTTPVLLNPLDRTQWEYMGNRDWTSYFIDKATFSHTHQVAVSGATEKTQFYLSGGVDDESGILSDFADDHFRRYSIRSKISYRLRSWMKLSNHFSYVHTNRTKPSYISSRGTTSHQKGDTNLGIFYDLAPVDYDVNPDGTWANTEAGQTMARMTDGGRETAEYGRLQNTFSAELDFWQRALLVNANYTFMNGTEDYNWYQTKYLIGYGPDDIREEGSSRSYKSTTHDLYSVLELYATFNKLIGRRHSIAAIAGFNQEYNRWNWYKAEREGLVSASLPSMALASGEQLVSEQYTDWAIRGLFFRANYTFDDRYIFEINGRYDGTSRFPQNKRFGFFPSASVAWRADSESFFEALRSAISQLKLRASFGSLGNQSIEGAVTRNEYGYIPSMTSALGSYLIDGKRPQVVNAPGLVSSNYTWETVITQNAGIDVGFLNNRVSVTYDMYRRDTRGMLTLGKKLPGVLGASEPRENAADMKTTGWELSLAYTDRTLLAGKPLSWGAKLTVSDSRSWITRFENPNKNLRDYYIGQELGEIWGLQNDGIFHTDAEIRTLDESDIIPWGSLEIVPGWPKYKDLDHDNRITKGALRVDDSGDLSIIGNNTPRYRFGFNLNGEWSGIDVSVFMQGIGKQDYYPLSFLYWSFYQQPYAGGQTHIFDFYRPENDSDVDRSKHSQAYLRAGLANQHTDAFYPVLQCWLADKNLGTSVDNSMGLAIPQTQYLLNAAYLRVKNITAGYTLPAAWLNKVHVARLRLFVSSDNLYEWSALKKYFDPEAVTNNSQNGYVYPFNRQFLFGINLTF